MMAVIHTAGTTAALAFVFALAFCLYQMTLVRIQARQLLSADRRHRPGTNLLHLQRIKKRDVSIAQVQVCNDGRPAVRVLDDDGAIIECIHSAHLPFGIDPLIPEDTHESQNRIIEKPDFMLTSIPIEATDSPVD